MRQLVLKPTFPLDESEIERRSFWKKAGHPVSWGTLVATVILSFSVKAGLLPFILLGSLGIYGIQRFWQSRSQKVTATVIQEMISESNAEQDLKLARIVKSYRSRGMHQYAAALGKFLLLKKHIEERLHAGTEEGQVTPTVEQVEKLVDQVCGAVCREFHKAASLDGQLSEVLTSRDGKKLKQLQENRSEVLEAVMHAYETLYEALASILDLETAREAAAPNLEAAARARLDEPDIDDIIEKLKEENRLARRVRDRFEIPGASQGDPDFGVFDEATELESEGERLVSE